MASGLTISGTTYTVGTNNISILLPSNSTSIGSMYTNATQYRYPRVTTGISVGTHYRGKVFNRLAGIGHYSTSIQGQSTIQVNWGVISWSLNFTIYAINTGISAQPTAPDGYQVYMDTATSTTATVQVTSALYGATFNGWIGADGPTGGVLSFSNPYSWNGLSATSSLYAYWT